MIYKYIYIYIPTCTHICAHTFPHTRKYTFINIIQYTKYIYTLTTFLYLVIKVINAHVNFITYSCFIHINTRIHLWKHPSSIIWKSCRCASFWTGSSPSPCCKTLHHQNDFEADIFRSKFNIMLLYVLQCCYFFSRRLNDLNSSSSCW